MGGMGKLAGVGEHLFEEILSLPEDDITLSNDS